MERLSTIPRVVLASGGPSAALAGEVVDPDCGAIMCALRVALMWPSRSSSCGYSTCGLAPANSRQHTEHLEQQVRCHEGGRPKRIIRRADLDQIGSHHAQS